MVDQAIDFILSKLNRTVGTRDTGVQAPVSYDLPQTAVAEAIVNAVAHRDYSSSGSVQVMLFSDRLEVWNPGALAPGLSLEALQRAHPSIPGNPLIAEPLFLAKYIEKAGSGTVDMIRECVGAGLPRPEFRLDSGCFVTTLWRPAARSLQSGPATEQVTEQVRRLVKAVADDEISASDAMDRLGLSHRPTFLYDYLQPAIKSGLLKMTIPDNPRSSRQKYRLTDAGKQLMLNLDTQ